MRSSCHRRAVGETDIERSQKAETRLLAAREIQPIAGIAQQDRASLRGLLGQRALVEFASADDLQSWRYRLPCAFQRLA